MAKNKPKKPQRPKAETPKGFRDYFGQEVIARQEMLGKITQVYRQFGFEPLESSAVETVEALGKFLPDVDRPNEGVFAWQDEDEAWMALRYDLTAPLARVYAQHRNTLPTPYRRYAVGPVWRNEKPGPGRFRQFYQCDADTVGTPTVAADTEICGLLATCLEAVGIARGDYVVRVNNRKLLDGALDLVFGWVPGADEDTQLGAVYDRASQKEHILRTIDKLDKVGLQGVKDLLGEGRLDPSGDFTKGAGLSNDQISVLLEFLGARENDGSKANENFLTLRKLRDLLQHTVRGREGVEELETIAELAEAQGFGPDRLVIDPSVVRGLGYYTGPVYEAELTFEILDEKGRPRQFGSVAGGGRYDDLVKRFTGQEVPATGVSIGVDRLLAALTAKGAQQKPAPGPVIVTVMDRDRVADYQTMVTELRNAGIRAEMYLGNPKNMGNQLKYADQRQSPVAVIQGSDELARGVVQLKDLDLGARLAAEITSNEEWKAQPAQREVAVEDLVAEVRKILDRG